MGEQATLTGRFSDLEDTVKSIETAADAERNERMDQLAGQVYQHLIGAGIEREGLTAHELEDVLYAVVAIHDRLFPTRSQSELRDFFVGAVWNRVDANPAVTSSARMYLGGLALFQRITVQRL